MDKEPQERWSTINPRNTYRQNLNTTRTFTNFENYPKFSRQFVKVQKSPPIQRDIGAALVISITLFFGEQK